MRKDGVTEVTVTHELDSAPGRHQSTGSASRPAEMFSRISRKHRIAPVREQCQR